MLDERNIYFHTKSDKSKCGPIAKLVVKQKRGFWRKTTPPRGFSLRKKKFFKTFFSKDPRCTSPISSPNIGRDLNHFSVLGIPMVTSKAIGLKVTMGQGDFLGKRPLACTQRASQIFCPAKWFPASGSRWFIWKEIQASKLEILRQTKSTEFSSPKFGEHSLVQI